MNASSWSNLKHLRKLIPFIVWWKQYLTWFVFQKASTCCYFVMDHFITKNLTLMLTSAKCCHSSVICNFPSSPNDITECTADCCLMDIGDFRSIRMQHKRGLSKSNIGASSPAGAHSLLPAQLQDFCEIILPFPCCIGIWAEVCRGQKSECLILLSWPLLFFFFKDYCLHYPSLPGAFRKSLCRLLCCTFVIPSL